jgi:chromosome segregation protein
LLSKLKLKGILLPRCWNLYLKRLDIQGFKSFPDKISLEFGSGITSVVGPNGSGKSNIADAIRWVLGEQSVKTLRGSKMEDVIFSGTEQRKPLGFAEVSLTIDNSDQSLPVDYSEVTITRRIFRSGESEYMINKAPCRLKDIYELLIDTGLGKDGYSVIGQGRIDKILSTRSEDRRNIFEEASGIMKYKVRKQEAEKKLESTRQNLLRINDIISELENQLEPLKQQSDTAKKYLAIRDSLKELEVNLYIENISRFKEKLSELEKQYSDIKSNIDSEKEKLEKAIRESRQKTELDKLLEEKLNETKSQLFNLEGGQERCYSDIRLNEEKIANLKRNIERLESEVAEITGKISLLFDEEKEKLLKLNYLYERHDDYSARLSKCEKQLESIIASLDESEKYVEDVKSGIIDKLDILSDKKHKLII